MQFGYTILYVRDVERTVSFYEDAFGLKRLLVHEGGYAEMDTGQTKLAFASIETARSNGVEFVEPSLDSAPPAAEVAFVTEDVAASYSRAVDAGAVAVTEPKKKPWGQTVSYVREINGFLIEICSPIAS